MNRTYRLVWNAALQTWAVAGELAKGRKKTSGKCMKLSLLLACSISTLSAYAVPAATALPTGESVASGSATFDRTVTNQLTVNQSTPKLITNWNSFDIGSAGSVNFVQPNAASIALNRVITGSPTEIFGQLSGNGQLVIVNPNGITFGAGSQVSAASVVASSLAITDVDFNADNFVFTRGITAGAVVNDGSIQAKNIALLSPDITNSGSISSTDGRVALVNADQVNAGTLTITQPSTIAGVIKNSGSIQATMLTIGNGIIVLQGDTSQSSSHIDLSGSINAAVSTNVTGKTINVVNSLSLGNNNNITAADNININADVIVGTAGPVFTALNLTYGIDAGENYFLNYGAKVDLLGLLPLFTVNATPYTVINDVNQLQNMALNLTGRYVLANDIDATATVGWNLGQGFIPVGNLALPFNGQIEGLGHAINGLTINRPGAGVGDYSGLFGYATSLVARHVGLSNASISGGHFTGGLVGTVGIGGVAPSVLQGNWVSGNITGADNVGGLAGQLNNSLLNGASVNKNYANAVVQGVNNVGGLLGASIIISAFSPMPVTISNNYVANSVTGASSVGGLIGSSTLNELLGSSTIYSIKDNSVAASVTGTGNTGGLIGNNLATTSAFGSTNFVISQNYNSGLVTGLLGTGGVVGQNNIGFGFSNVFQNNFWNTTTTGQLLGIGTNIGFPILTGLTGITTAQSVQLATFAPWGANIDATAGSGSTWRIYDGLSGPLLRSFLKPLTVTADDVTKTYDGTNFISPTYSYSRPTVDLSKIVGTVIAGGSALGARNAGNYVINLSGLHSTDQLGYDIGFADGALTINKKQLTISATAVNKVYDGRLEGGVKPNVIGRVRGDSIAGLSQSFADKNVGTGKTLTVDAGFVIRDGNGGNNYDVTVLDNHAGVITAKAITISTVANTKVYDGGVTSANKPLVTGLASGDRITGLFQQYATKTVGTNKPMVLKAGYILQDGNGGANYTVTEQTTNDGEITAH